MTTHILKPIFHSPFGFSRKTAQQCRGFPRYWLAVVSNCVIVGNSAHRNGGGSHRGTLNNCVLQSNSVWQTGAGGGAIFATLNNCLIAGNSGGAYGGGVNQCDLRNCVLVSNSAWDGGGTYGGGTLTHCTITGNSATYTGGVERGTVRNCVIYFNSSEAGGFPNSDLSGTRYNSCTTHLPSSGTGNITNAPLFVDTNGWSDLRLQSNSPCINAGNNAYVATTNDLDGNPRIVGGTADMGAYEYQFPQSSISYAYLQQYGLPTDGSVDNEDGDNDGATTWQEWKMWTIPTNQLSVLKMVHPNPQTNGTAVSWQSVSGHSYALERATNGAANFTLLQSGIAGQAGTTTFTDTTATNGDAFFYRVSVP